MRRSVTRREFLMRTAALAAAASTAPTLPPQALASSGSEKDATQAPVPISPNADVPPELVAEAEGRIAAILSHRGSRLTAEQKAEIRRLITLSLPGLAAMRAYPLTNAEAPATILVPYRRDGGAR